MRGNMSDSGIEDEARKLRVEISSHRKSLGLDETTPLVDLLDPVVAARVLGIQFEYHEDLGQASSHSNIAGLLDRRAKKILVSKGFKPETIRFTGAHEIGHWLLHPREMMHRDRPIEGLTTASHRRPLMEKEADQFAAYFLLPAKYVTRAFETTFLVKGFFPFNDNTAFWLCPDNPDSVLRPHNPRERSMALASTESYGGKHFLSLAKRFRVSATTMAIRLEELGLIEGIGSEEKGGALPGETLNWD